jgi:hypothetical protein
VRCPGCGVEADSLGSHLCNGLDIATRVGGPIWTETRTYGEPQAPAPKPKLSRAKLPAEVRNCIDAVRAALAEMDTAMDKPTNYERGRAVAKACNQIELAVDYLDHFGIKERRPRAAK